MIYIFFSYLQACYTEAAGELGAEGQTSALTGGQADGGGEQVQDGEDNRGDCGDHDDLLHVRDLARDDDHRNRDGQTLQEVFDGARE